MWEAFTQILVDIIGYLHSFTGNYGWDIILLTIAVRLVMFPLTLSGLRGMKAMQVAQPRIKEIQEKYKDDKEKLNKELMAFYKEIGFNPMSSCLPMLLQMPIFIALYRVLAQPELNGFILVNESFYGMNLTSSAISHVSPYFLRDVALVMPGMIDLSFIYNSTHIGLLQYFQDAFLYTPVLIVVVLMSVTTIVQQKMMTVDPNQQSTMWMMNIFIVGISFFMPAGVLLYWGVSNVLQFAQQALIKGPNLPKSKTTAKGGDNKKKKSAAPSQAKGPEGKKQQKQKDINKQNKEEKDRDQKKSGADAKPASPGGGKTYPASSKKGGSKKKKRKKKK